ALAAAKDQDFEPFRCRHAFLRRQKMRASVLFSMQISPAAFRANSLLGRAVPGRAWVFAVNCDYPLRSKRRGGGGHERRDMGLDVSGGCDRASQVDRPGCRIRSGEGMSPLQST